MTFIPDPTKYEPRRNPAKPEQAKPAFQHVKDLSDDALRILAREKLSEALQAIDPQAQPELTRKLCAEVKDRLDGKPAQSITSTVHSTVAMLVANVKTDDELLARIKRDLLASPIIDH